jgi:uroporphyrin-III C-methyltransferase
MPNGRYRDISDEVVAAGLSPQTPCLIVSNACRAEQELLWTDVAGLRRISVPKSPSLLIIGEVARRREEMSATASAMFAEYAVALEATG